MIRTRMVDYVKKHSLQLLFIAVTLAIVLIHVLPMIFPPNDFPGDVSYGCPGY